MTGLYVHIPFCQKKCHYCNFVITTKDAALGADIFLKALEEEMRHYADDFKKTKLDTVYIGGGTPSALDIAQTEKFFSLVRRYFKIKPKAEITWEVNPGDADLNKAKHYRALGINRISVGVQSFSDASLKKINRTHDSAAIYQSFDGLRRAGFDNISMDLMLSLPGESLADVSRSLEETAKLSPEHVSLYELVIEEKTVFGNWHRQKKLKLPDEVLQVRMLETARNFLKQRGWRHYELLSYARPGFESSHNRLYWANQDYLGLGPGAFSYLKGRRFRLTNGVEEYYKKMEMHDWNACDEEFLDPDRKEVESFLLALRLVEEGVSKKIFKKLLQKKKIDIADLIHKGLLEETTRVLRLTARGQLFAESVFTQLSGVC